MQTPIEIGVTFEQGGCEYVVCYVVNDRSLICLPVELIQDVHNQVGDIEVIWPLGVYVVFTSDGMSVLIFGRMDGELVHKGCEFGLQDPDRFGPQVRESWERLRDVNKETISRTLHELVEETHASRSAYDSLDFDRLFRAQDRLTDAVAETQKVRRSQVITQLYFTEKSDIVIDVQVDGEPVDLSVEPYNSIVRQIHKDHSAVKPN